MWEIIILKSHAYVIWPAQWLSYGQKNPGFESRQRQEIFFQLPEGFWDPPSHLFNGYWCSFGGQSGWGVKLTIHPQLVPRLKYVELKPLLFLYAVMVWTATTLVFAVLGRCRALVGISLPHCVTSKKSEGLNYIACSYGNKFTSHAYVKRLAVVSLSPINKRLVEKR